MSPSHNESKPAHRTEKMSTAKKVLIGILGGLCVVIYRAMRADFYMSGGDQVMKAALLYSAGSVFMSAVLTAFIDEHKPYKLLMHGVAAPGIIFTLLQSGPTTAAATPSDNAPPPIEHVNAIPARHANPVFAFLLPSAYADDSSASRVAAVQPLRQAELKGSLADGFAYLFGYKTAPADNSIIVIAQSSDTTRALAAANRLTELTSRLGAGSIRLLQPEGHNEIYLTLGGVTTGSEAHAKLDALTGLNLPDSSQAALVRDIELLQKAHVIDANDLFKRTP